MSIHLTLGVPTIAMIVGGAIFLIGHGKVAELGRVACLAGAIALLTALRGR